MMSVEVEQRGLSPWHVLLFAGGYLAAAWGVFFVVDVGNVAGLRDRLIATGLQDPTIWHRLFMEGGVTEMLQWMTLGIAGVLAAMLAGRCWHAADPSERAAARFWLIMSVALTVMLIEDAGNPRHQVRQWAHTASGSFFVSMLAEGVCFLLIAAVPVYAVLRYGRTMWGYRNTRWYLLIGFATYATVSTFSASRHVGEWYIAAGTWIHAMVGGDLVRYDHHQPLEFWLMDWLVEETLELIGAAFMLAAGVAFFHERRR
ncbi:hypothetical protein ACERK3_02185 [Phycisphaerales bacterium AB-hyl4]|uniref:Uncharacterized protein n=1 Tax=Natronomicrosphaera hydrolytica TaxID=3242702 RepID=A0ABV4U0G7_9BACT